MPPIRDVVGYCPMGCGPHLHVMSGGMIMCLAKGCPDPGAVTGILSDPETSDIVQVNEDGFSILYPLRERLGGGLFDCPVNKALAAMAEPPALPGRYRATMEEDGMLDLAAMESSDQEIR
jgi:hypothetical protein